MVVDADCGVKGGMVVGSRAQQSATLPTDEKAHANAWAFLSPNQLV